VATPGSAGAALRDLVNALLGISTFQPPTQPGPELGDAQVDQVRRVLGGALEPIPSVRLRWYPPDIERAQMQAQSGNMMLLGQLSESMQIDGVIRGLMDARTSVVNFPRRLYGDEDIVSVLESKNASDRNVYDEMIPATEARLMVGDGIKCGMSVGEMVPVKGRDFPVLVRRYPQNLFYLWTKNQWYYRGLVGLMPITPGIPRENGNSWVMHFPGGRLSPWNSGLWNTLGRSYINKTQTLFARQSYEMKHSHPARVAFAPLGANEEERKGFLSGVIRWAMNAAFALTPGWDLKLIESNGRGIEIYEQSIKTYNEEIATSLCGSAVMLQGTTGFSNMDVFRVVQTDLITTTAEAWDHTVNTQILPAFIAGRWGAERLFNATSITTDTQAPKDRSVEAQTMLSVANAVKGLVEALAAAQSPEDQNLIRLNIVELVRRFGVPIVEGAPPRPAELATSSAPKLEAA
jgi:hypothetical protein